MGEISTGPTTKERILEDALTTFGTRGYDATSLDALAGQLGIRKQTILYHFSTKEDLLTAVVDRAALDLLATIEQALDSAGPESWERVEALVRRIFRLALVRPELLGLMREVSRPGSSMAERLAAQMEPLIRRGRIFLQREMAAGRFQKADANYVMLSAYSAVVGVATEVEVSRALGIEPTLRSMVERRKQILHFLNSALLENTTTSDS